MPRHRLDYDRIAPSYDRRDKVDRKDLAAALRSLAQRLNAERILEVGCGTGHWLAEVHQVTEDVWGLDPSAGMLRRAHLRSKAFHLVRGRAGRLPFADASFDLVFCANAIHHFDGQRAFVSQARRVLGPGGALAVIGQDPRGRRDSWYVYRYFEGTYETDLRRFPSWGTVVDWLIASGFERIEWRPVQRILDPKFGREVLDDPFLQKEATSQLALLSDEAYATGLRRIERALAEAEAAGERLVFSSDLSLAMLTGYKGEGE